MLGSSRQTSARLAALVESSLREVALGALAVLNAHFYESLGTSFVEAALSDPLRAYREALGVLPEAIVKTMFRLALRALGASGIEAARALEALERGDSTPFLNIVLKAERRELGG